MDDTIIRSSCVKSIKQYEESWFLITSCSRSRQFIYTNMHAANNY